MVNRKIGRGFWLCANKEVRTRTPRVYHAGQVCIFCVMKTFQSHLGRWGMRKEAGDKRVELEGGSRGRDASKVVAKVRRRDEFQTGASAATPPFGTFT